MIITRSTIAQAIRAVRNKTGYTLYLKWANYTGAWKFKANRKDYGKYCICKAMEGFGKEERFAWDLAARKEVSPPVAKYWERSYQVLDFIKFADPKKVTVWIGGRDHRGALDKDSPAFLAATAGNGHGPGFTWADLKEDLNGSEKFYVLKMPAVAWMAHVGTKPEILKCHANTWEYRVFDQNKKCVAQRLIKKAA